MTITNAQNLQSEFQKLADTFDKITPFEHIPAAIRSELMAIFSNWNDAYDTKDWGSANTGAKWTLSEQTKWNETLLRAKVLLKQAAQAPGTRIEIEQKISKQIVPIKPEEEITVKATIPWYWLIGTVGLLTVFVSMFSKGRKLSLAGMPDEHNAAMIDLLNQFEQEIIDSNKFLHSKATHLANAKKILTNMRYEHRWTQGKTTKTLYFEALNKWREEIEKYRKQHYEY